MFPSDLNLPPKFSEWRRIDSRRTQYDAIIDAASSDKRFIILNAPTGVGKSTIYMGLAAMLGGRTLVLTDSKNLQDQLYRDFAPMGLVEIKGQSNYGCLYFDDGRRTLPGCDEGPCHASIQCNYRDKGCRYYDAVRRAAGSSLVIANYAYWMNVQKFADPESIGVFDRIILDEAHNAASTLADFVKVTIDRAHVFKLLGLEPLRNADIDAWVEWGGEALRVCNDRIEAACASASAYRESVAIVRRLKSLRGELQDLVWAHTWRRTDAPNIPAWIPGTATDWIIEETPTMALFQPVWATAYSEKYLFGGIPSVVMVSATVTPKDAGFLGIPPSYYDYFQYPSPFPLSTRPVYIVPTARVGRSMSVGETRIWLSRIDQIIAKEAVDRGVKGIIHARSYERARQIFAASEHKDLLMIHDPSNTRKTVEQFKRASGAAVLISPAVSTGHDFPLDECRFQIIAKVPFIDNRPAVIQARAKSDRKYLDYIAMVELIQMAGRGVRSESDFCNTYIIDDNFAAWFFPRNRDLVPKWFRSAIRKVRLLSEVA